MSVVTNLLANKYNNDNDNDNSMAHSMAHCTGVSVETETTFWNHSLVIKETTSTPTGASTPVTIRWQAVELGSQTIHTKETLHKRLLELGIKDTFTGYSSSLITDEDSA